VSSCAQSDAALAYLIQDPFHEYATRFVEHIYRKYGYRAICFYTDRRRRLREERNYPILRSQCVAASYDIPADSLGHFASYVRSRHRVAGVIPFNEITLRSAIELATGLELSWVQPREMRRIQDKFALKDQLRREHSHIRINASRRVDSLAAILSARSDAAYARFVLKPNDGYGNRGIGFFDSNSPPGEIEAFLRRHAGAPILMEEYVDGAEYFVNGQVDGAGRVAVVAIFQYTRIPANGRLNIDFATLLVHHHDPRFAELARYAEQVLVATGLRRSPFHLEIKLDRDGPCMIELGARLAGHGNAVLCGELHGGLDLIELAAHYYLHAEDYGPIPLDWASYDSAAVHYVHGIATRRERIYRLGGIAAIEALPEFHGWARKPTVGEMLEPTIDSLTMPFSLILRARREADVLKAEAQVRQLLRWNESIGLPLRIRATVAGRLLLRRYSIALRVRVLSLLQSEHRSMKPVSVIESGGTLFERICRRGLSLFDRLVWRWQRLGRRVRPESESHGQGCTDSILAWARNYVAVPHPELKRTGPICPFVQPSIELGQFTVKCFEGILDADLRRVRRIILDEAQIFLERTPVRGAKGKFASVVLAFPRLSPPQDAMLDRIHEQLKAHLVERYDLMTAAFHPQSSKPSISNPEFAVFRAPVPLFVIRHLDVRDVLFLGNNERAFRRYRARFGTLFDRGEVSNEFGYVERYAAACARFGMKAPSIAAARSAERTSAGA
jgi:hypothetical protein